MNDRITELVGLAARTFVKTTYNRDWDEVDATAQFLLMERFLEPVIAVVNALDNETKSHVPHWMEGLK